VPRDSLERLKQASVFISSPDGTTGSGYLIAPNRVATALHVVRGWERQEDYEVFVGVQPRTARKARLLKVDQTADAALLSLDSPVDETALPVADGLTRNARWEAYGYPALATKTGRPSGLPIEGVVRDPSTTTDGTNPAVLLSSADIAAGNASPLHGFSGSPVVVDGAVVGHLIKHIGDTDDPKRAAYGYVYACPIAAVVALLDNVAVARKSIAPAAVDTLSDVVPQVPADRYHVFISYRSTDRCWAKSLVTRLEGVGLRVFIDEKELEIGKSLAGQLQSALMRSRSAVVLVSKGWIDSPWCQQEFDVLLDRALKEPGFVLAPLRLDDSVMPALLNSRLWIDFNGLPRAEGDGVERLINTLLKRVAKPGSVAEKEIALEQKVTDEFVARIISAAVGSIADVEQALEDWRKTASADLTPLFVTANVMVGKGRPDWALRELENAGDALRARQLRALALSKLGRHKEAIVQLEALQREGNVDAETLGLLAGRYKAVWLQTGDEAYKRRSYETYRDVYERTGDPFNGINAASMALHCGDTATRFAIAQQVCNTLSGRPKNALTHWDLATLGECCLLREKFDDAKDWYSRAAAAAAGLPQDRAVMRAQARRNLEAMGKQKDLMDACLPVPRVLAYTGHMVDEPGRKEARLPATKVGRLRNEIRRRLKNLGALHGFGTAARGSDIIVLEALHERGLTATIVIPFPAAAFKTTSLGDSWNERFDNLMSISGFEFSKPLFEALPPNAKKLGDAFAKANKEVFQRAVAFARSLDEKPIVLAVWDGQPGDGPGGTADAVQLWMDEGYTPVIIDPRTI
jgi:tetratricopeptide (TPR) repeat protein